MDESDKKDVKEFRTAASGFMQDLKIVLTTEMKNNGIVSAVSVCSDTAQVMSQTYSKESDLLIKRVSLKVRNPLNAPDEFEEKVLKDFEKMKAEGTLNDSTEVIAEINENDAKSVRYMKPILIQGTCLGCHGSETSISKDVKKVLTERYPEDKAVNYKAGDVRGAVSIVKTVK